MLIYVSYMLYVGSPSARTKEYTTFQPQITMSL